MAVDFTARQQIGSLQGQLPRDSVTMGIPRDSNPGTSTGTGASTTLQALSNVDAPEVLLRGNYDSSVSTSTGAMLLDGPVTVKSGQRWRGDGRKALFTVAPNDPAPGGYFLLGTTLGLQSAQAYDLHPNKQFGRIRIDGRTATANGNRPVAVVVGGPGWRIHDIYANGIQTVVRSADLGGTGVDAHADHLRITNVHLNNQSNPVDFDPVDPTSARYGIDWLRSNVGGDAVEIERCQSNISGTGLTAKRCRFIGIRGFTSAMIRGIVNGDVYFYQSVGTLADSYFEHGVITNLESDLTISNCHFWMRNEAVWGTDVGAIPVQMVPRPVALGSIAQGPASLVMRDCVWNYDGTGVLGGYSTANVNFTFPTAIFGTVDVANCFRGAPYSNGRGWYQRLGVTCGDSEFDTYSHFASIKSRCMVSGTVGGKRWMIEGRSGPISLTSATSINALENTALDPTNKNTWKAASGTYYYRAAIYHDRPRAVGVLGALEVSASPTNGNTGVALKLGYDIAGGGYMIRIYRGTATGSYDRYVDVPVVEAGYLFDSGLDVGGFVWITRTAGAPDPVNAGLCGGIELTPGERTTASDAYGRCTAVSLTGAMPTVGGWRRGDRVTIPNSAVTGTLRQTGWRRLTNCTSAAPSHVLGTDWEPVYSQLPPANGQTIASGSTTSLTLKPGERVATIRPTSATQTVTVDAANEVVGYWFYLNVYAQNPTSFAAKIAKGSNASVSVTLSAAGLYFVVWREDLAAWTAVRVGDSPISGTIDEAANCYEQYVTTFGAVSFDPNARMINVSSTSGAVAITMPASLEQGGTTRRLLVRTFTNPVTVAKASGTLGSSGVITQTGLYELVFTQGNWLATRIGNVPA